MTTINSTSAVALPATTSIPAPLTGVSAATSPFAFGVSNSNAQAALSAMGINPPSQVGTILKNVGIFGGIGAALGLGAMILPGIGPIVAAISGAAGVLVGLVKGISNANDEQSVYNLQLASMQQSPQALQGTFPGNTSPFQPRTVDSIVQKTMSELDPDGHGSITISQAPSDARQFLTFVDSKGNADGTVTSDEVRNALSGFDAKRDGTLDQVELLDLMTSVIDSTDSAASTPSATTTSAPATAGDVTPPPAPIADASASAAAVTPAGQPALPATTQVSS